VRLIPTTPNFVLCSHRRIPRLFPFLKKFGIRFYGYSPLAGSVLAGKDLDVAVHDGSRFDTKAVGDFIGQYYTNRYFPLIPAAQEMRDEGVSLPRTSY
jgi:aflatoxin B1 aldehyde reductase